MKNIILTGMPGVGKSTIGVILAKELGYQFVDSDLVIQERKQAASGDYCSGRCGRIFSSGKSDQCFVGCRSLCNRHGRQRSIW